MDNIEKIVKDGIDKSAEFDENIKAAKIRQVGKVIFAKARQPGFVLNQGSIVRLASFAETCLKFNN